VLIDVRVESMAKIFTKSADIIIKNGLNFVNLYLRSANVEKKIEILKSGTVKNEVFAKQYFPIVCCVVWHHTSP